MLPQDIFSTDFICETPKYRKHEEIGQFLKNIEKENKGIAELEVIGNSLEERPIYCLSLGNKKAQNKILLLANAHGEELRGCEEILHLTKTLVENPDLKKKFLQNYHFHVVPTINPDARVYNLRWAKEKFDLEEFFLSAKRHIEDKEGVEADIEWGYPLDKDDKRVIRRPETLAIKQLMDSKTFDLYLDLHGAVNAYDTGFWYLIGQGQKRREECIDFLYSTGKYSGLPLNEIEKIDNCIKIKPGIHNLCTIKDVLKVYEGNEKLTEWVKEKFGCSSLDYLTFKNPDAQAFVAEFPTFYHERYLDSTLSDRLKKDVKKESLDYFMQLGKEKIIPLTEKALNLSQHPKLKEFLKEKKEIGLESLKDQISKLDEEYGQSKANLGEIKDLEISKYWCCPGYGRTGLSGVINRLPEEEQKKLKPIYKICKNEVKKAIKKVDSFDLKEFSFKDSINLQSKTCLGLIQTYFS